jgi:hypothetical protein
MDDGFINKPGDDIHAAIAGMELHPAGNVVAPPPRSSRRRGVASRPKFDPPNLTGTSQNIDLAIILDRFESATRSRPAESHIGAGGERALELLDRRIAGGDTELLPVKDVVRRCLSLISAMPPLSHVDSAPLRPDDRLYEFFDQFLSLLRQQESQMQDLQTMINELF